MANHTTVCEAAFNALKECLRLTAAGCNLRQRIPALYLHRTLDELGSHDMKVVTQTLADCGQDGLSIARWLCNTLHALTLVLSAVNEVDPQSDLVQYQIAIQRLEWKLSQLLEMLQKLSVEPVDEKPQVWTEVLSANPAESLLSSGDFFTFWRDHFSKRWRVRPAELVQALRLARGLDSKACERLLPWLSGAGEAEVELADAAVVLDNLGFTRGIAFCTSWPDLAGHAYITAIWSKNEMGRRAVMTGADIALRRRERECSLLLPGWSREALRKNKPFLLALMVLGMEIACDVSGGLLLQFEEPDAPLALVPGLAEAMQDEEADGTQGDGGEEYGAMSMGGGRESKESKLANVVVDLVKALKLQPPGGMFSGGAGDDGLAISFVVPGKESASSSALDHAWQGENKADAQYRNEMLTGLQQRKLGVLHDYSRVIEILSGRIRVAHDKRSRSCDPSFRSEAWPALQAALQDMKMKEEQVNFRKGHLSKMEEESDNPEQIAHIRALLQEVAEAEEEQDKNVEWLANQETKWIEEENCFQEDRRRRDLACRQRVAVMLLDLRHRQQQRGQLIVEVMCIHDLLLDLEENFATSRGEAHEYDQELTATIHEKESLLSSLTQALALVKEQSLETRAATAEMDESRERIMRLQALQVQKVQHLSDIDAWEKKLADLKAKHSVVVLTNER